mmetsp:Transcript_8741/g.25182  ORF Transcript_8741/g.25182 Transcript_8741/m.25182 type:complete len:557 (+) Transcript_8741:281-1951(+)
MRSSRTEEEEPPRRDNLNMRAAYSNTQLVIIHDSDDEGDESNQRTKGWFSFKKLMAFLGPGLLMSIAYVDPGNLESDLQAGATASCTLLWLLLLSTTMGFFLQMLAARLGVATGWDLAEHCRIEYHWFPRYLLWIQTEIAIIGSDVQEVIGSAIAFQILSRGYIPLWAGVVITSLDCFIFLYVERGGIRKLEMLFAFFITVMFGAFGWMFTEVGPSPAEITRGLFIPTLNKQNIHQATALLGALIMPHNLFLHSSLVHTRHINSRRKDKVKEAVRFFAIESAMALLVTFFINIFVIAVFSAGFYGNSTIDEIGLGNAGKYLENRFGLGVVIIWGLGLLAAGQSSTMTGTYTGQFVMCGFLNLNIKPWQRTFVTRGVALLPTLAVSIICQSPTALDKLTQGLNVLQSVQLPFALIPLLTFTSSKRIMGYMVNSLPMTILSWCIATTCLSINGYLVISQLDELPASALFRVPFYIFVSLYLLFVTYLVISPAGMRGMARNLNMEVAPSPVPASWLTRQRLQDFFKEATSSGQEEEEGTAAAAANGGAAEPLLSNGSSR